MGQPVGKGTARVVGAILTAAAAAAGPAVAQDAVGPVTLEFVKENPEGGDTWSGSVSGPVSGDLTTVLLSADQDQPVWLVSFEAAVDAGDRSFRAHVGGTLDTTTGRVDMSGAVTDGYLLGSSVDWQGQMVDEAASRFSGTISLTPPGASAAANAAGEDDQTARTREVFEGYAEAHDASYYAEDATFTDMTQLDNPVVGRDAIAAFLAGFYGTEGPFTEGRGEAHAMLVQGDTVMLEFTYRGRHTGPLGEIAPTGKEVTVRAMSIYRIEDGEIQSARLYYDPNDLLRQLGAIPGQ